MRDLYQVALKTLGSPREFGEGFRTPGEPWIEPWGSLESSGTALDSPGGLLGGALGSPEEPWGPVGHLTARSELGPGTGVLLVYDNQGALTLQDSWGLAANK